MVEQGCAYPELDGRDLEPATVHVWAQQSGAVLGCLRVLTDALPTGPVRRIGRVCTVPPARRTGVARELMLAALVEVGSAPCVLDAQAYLIDFYASFGFVPAGELFLEEGIAHLPMRRD